MKETWTEWGSSLAGVMFLLTAFRQIFPSILCNSIAFYARKIFSFLNPYTEITFIEHSHDGLQRSEAYAAVQSYLAVTCSGKARCLKVDHNTRCSDSDLFLVMNDHEEVVDSFSGVKFYWSSQIHESYSNSLTLTQPPPDRRYSLSFRSRHRDLVAKAYIRHVLDEGKAIGFRNRRRRIYTNSTTYDNDFQKRIWSHVPFEHPATFDTIAMDPEKKRELVEDLMAFSRGKEFYLRIGKPWKRGYLLYGPPGTGKSTMIAAMANLLDYDIYDLELTAVKNNSALRKLLLEVSGRSIIVIEDIDCSADLSKKRENKAAISEVEKMMGKEESKQSNVTLSGLLNFIDGLWSACGGERVVVLTTNFVEKLDPALIRRGRMDRHIELSYCDFQGFRVLARNYLGIEEHDLFDEIRCLLEERNITPADVAENLMPKKNEGVAGIVEVCLRSLIRDLMASKLKSAEGDDMMETTTDEDETKTEISNERGGEEEEMVEATVATGEEEEGEAEE